MNCIVGAFTSCSFQTVVPCIRYLTMYPVIVFVSQIFLLHLTVTEFASFFTSFGLDGVKGFAAKEKKVARLDLL